LKEVVVDELSNEVEKAPNHNCTLDVEEAEALISCMDKAVKQAPDSINAALSLYEVRKKLEQIARDKRPG
jgi:hypothetical protein